jgi:hypothetical protein
LSGYVKPPIEYGAAFFPINAGLSLFVTDEKLSDRCANPVHQSLCFVQPKYPDPFVGVDALDPQIAQLFVAFVPALVGDA